MKKKGKKTRIEEIHDIKKGKNAKTNLERRPWLVSEDILGDIRDNGGDVRYMKEENTNNVEVLCVQSKEMRKQLTESKPFVFECDTTFGTQRRVTSYIFLSITAISLCQGFCSLQAKN